MEMLLIQKLNMWIILLPTDTEFEEDHSYKHYLKCACFKNTYIDSENNE